MTTESQITAWLATQQDAMVALLREMVDIDSGSYNKPGIDAVGAVVQRFMAAQGIGMETLPQKNHGDCLRAAVPWDGPQGNAGGNIVLMGHRDTVFPDGEVARRPFTIRDGVAYGPGSFFAGAAGTVHGPHTTAGGCVLLTTFSAPLDFVLADCWCGLQFGLHLAAKRSNSELQLGVDRVELPPSRRNIVNPVG